MEYTSYIIYDKYYYKGKILNINILVVRWIPSVGGGGGYKRQRNREKVNGNPRLYIIIIIIYNTTYLCAYCDVFISHRRV